MAKKEKFYADVMSLHHKVTGSCNLVSVRLPEGQRLRFIVDLGMFQGREEESLNDTLEFDPENIEFCLVTHNHVDHTGRLPLLIKKGYRKKIYMTKGTQMLIPHALKDSYKVCRDTSRRKGKKSLYNEMDVEKTLDLISGVDFNETIEITENVKVTFLKNGHLPGAALILVQIFAKEYETINLLFTGDYKKENIFFDVDDIPSWIKKLPISIIQESTYGDRKTSNTPKCFSKNVLNCLQNNGTVVALVFSLGRAQEILYELKMMQKNGLLDKDIKIYYDGKLSIKYSKIYQDPNFVIRKEMQDFMPENSTIVNKENRDQVLKDQNKKIIVTTSGMGTYGPAQIYIPEFIQKENCLIQFTGYTAKDTLGGTLKSANKGEEVKIGGMLLEKLADVEYLVEYSAHADQEGLIEFLKQFTNIKIVLINHGETNTKKRYAKQVLREIDTNYVGILGENYLFRISPYGLVKTMTTKWL